ncbi:MAG: hypothetical protein EBU08_07820 [Micrococcales bacterium]|nr:hypothetical protein [Micrococcales bacterium]
MTQEVIDIGTAPNDGLGDPLREAFAKTNNNFSQLFATSGVSGISNGSSNVNIPLVNGNVVISSAGTANVLTVTGTGVNVAGTLNSSGLATLGNLSVTGTVISTGTIQGLGAVTAVTVTASGNSSANNAIVSNLLTAGQLSLTGNIVSATVTGNIVGSNIATSGLVTATGNITGGNVITAGQVSAVGNITAAFFTGNGAGLTGVVASGNVGAASKLLNGTSEMNIPASGGNIVGNVAGVTNVFTLTTAGLIIAGVVSASGNVTSGNLLTAGLISSTGTVTGSSLLGSVVSVTANVTGGNITTGGLVSASGNVAATYFLGNGALLTGVITSVANINSGTSNVVIVSSGGNVAVGVGGTSNVAVFATSGEYVTGVVSASGNITGGNLITGGQVSAAANITGGNILTGGLISSAGNITSIGLTTIGAGGAISGTGNITAGNFLTSGLITATGNITGGNLTVGTGNVTAGNIVNANGNAVGNIGSSSNYFNQVFAQATTALYADLAEVYSADAKYSAGTVVVFGGTQEVTVSTVDSSRRVAGIISEKPSYLMNSGLEAEHCAVVALTGRVPTQVIGPVVKGDMMVSTSSGRARAEAEPMSGAVIGKALEDFDGVEGTIEIVVGRL